jgi:hypothetical protein
MQSLKLGKACGFDGIPNEYILQFQEVILRI